jgi:hypothetical protein
MAPRITAAEAAGHECVAGQLNRYARSPGCRRALGMKGFERPAVAYIVGGDADLQRRLRAFTYPTGMPNATFPVPNGVEASVVLARVLVNSPLGKL